MTKDSWRAMLVFWWQAGVLPSTQLSNAAFAKPWAYNAGRIDSERSFMSEKNSKPKKLSLSGSGKLTLGGGGVDQTTLRSGCPQVVAKTCRLKLGANVF